MKEEIKDLSHFFQTKIEKNFEQLHKYGSVEPVNLFELGFLMRQNYFCLLLELYTPSITMTNHILERLLKLSIITNLSKEKSDEESEKIHDLYDSMVLAKVIIAAEGIGIIVPDEREFLMQTVRDVLRNGFSHAETGKILKDVPDKMQMFKFSFSDPTQMEPVIISRKVITAIGQEQMNNFAEEIAQVYYIYVFELFHRIEKRLSDKK